MNKQLLNLQSAVLGDFFAVLQCISVARLHRKLRKSGFPTGQKQQLLRALPDWIRVDDVSGSYRSFLRHFARISLAANSIVGANQQLLLDTRLSTLVCRALPYFFVPFLNLLTLCNCTLHVIKGFLCRLLMLPEQSRLSISTGTNSDRSVTSDGIL